MAAGKEGEDAPSPPHPTAQEITLGLEQRKEKGETMRGAGHRAEVAAAAQLRLPAAAPGSPWEAQLTITAHPQPPK